jgi:hypothetical protein
MKRRINNLITLAAHDIESSRCSNGMIFFEFNKREFLWKVIVSLVRLLGR